METEGEEGCVAVPVLSKEEALSRLGNDLELYNEILTVFLKEFPLQVDTIKKCFESNHLPLLEQESHSLKGASANVGADAVAQIAAKIEMSAKAEKWEVAKAFLPELEKESDRLFEYLKKHCIR
ncbi:MAG: Hpt domain-containing protein [Nitrospinota bacterium]